MKYLFFAIVLCLLSLQTLMAESLVLINYKNTTELNQLYQNPNFIIHYSADEFVIVSAFHFLKGDYVTLDPNAWTGNSAYYIVWFYKGLETAYVQSAESENNVLLKKKDFIIIKTTDSKKIAPPIQGCIAKIDKSAIKKPDQKFNSVKSTMVTDPDIVSMINAVDTNIYLTNLQHLQDYGTRNAYTAQSVQAQNWLKSKFESYGYATELFDFTMPSGPASDNVLATKPGTKYPNEYVVIGGHYDSYSYSGNAPGADDDGTGTCGVLEAARVMASYDFDRTIIFCCWSGEEYGLYGSGAWASWAQGQNMDILGYFNIDMCGYRYPGDPIHTDIIAPSSAQPLVDFYMDVCSLYLPDFIVEMGSLSGGDSDHTSFNNNGYMGIFPFEDSQHYSPYIHTSNDVIGTSVNSLEMAMTFTQAAIASVASMANYLAPPQNLAAISGDDFIELSWDPLVDVDHYNIYRDGILLDATTDLFYVDENVVEYTTYVYYVTAVFTGTFEETSPSNTVTITLLPRMSFPFTDDFESGANYWTFEGSWGLSTNSYHSSSHSLTESPTGNYTNNLSIVSGLYTFSLAYTSEASISFWTKYTMETNYDYMYFEISTNGTTWTILDTYNGTQSSWVQKTYSLTGYLGENSVMMRFRFYSDYSVTKDGMYIDDFSINKTTELNIKAFLEGPYEGTEMNTALNSKDLLPLNQPFDTSPWNYSGTESVASIPNENIVDWVLIEIRDANIPASSDAGSVVERMAAFLLKDGSVVDLDGIGILEFQQQLVQNMYVVLRHRNHLDIISSLSPNETGGSYSYDFTLNANQAYGGSSAQKDLGSGVYGLMGGDGNADNVIDNADKTIIWQLISGKKGYGTADYNMDGQINNLDKNEYWLPNIGSGSQVPE
ncbi:MAG: M28 family peptidase [Bacteroidales bacterium]|nr:M28 family peptidase [Bacteroidales bacterium]